MASAQPLLLASGLQREEVGRTEQLSEDEFACPGEARGLLLSVQPLVERIFGVTFDVGVTEKEPLPRNEQIWVKMRGMKSEVEAAKLFVKGLMSQEEWQEMSYPQALHCVFTGAQGLFMDCLIKNTSANIEVGPAGSLLISGLAEQVVQAYSFVDNLVEQYKSTQGRHAEQGTRALHESLDSRLAFKALVEQREDQYTLDLLVLPGAVKEILLNMVKDSRLDRQLEGTRAIAGRCRETERSPLQDMETQSLGGNMSDREGGSSSEEPGVFMERALHFSWSHQPHNQSVSRVSDEGKGSSSGGERVRKGDEVRDTDLPHPAFCNALSKIGNQGRAEFGERVLGHVPQEVGEEDGLEGLSLSVGSRKEFSLQLNFFTAMGYSEHVVRRVLDRTGPTEVSQILDLVQQEHDREVERERDLEPKGGPADDGRHEEGGAVARANGGEEGWRAVAPKMLEEERVGDGGKLGEDYILTVLKKAAASCGYTAERVMEVYTNLPGLSVGELLQELQKVEQRSKGGDRVGGHMEPRRGPEQDGKAEEQEVDRRSGGRSKRKEDGNTREPSADGVSRPAAAGEPVRFNSPRRHTQVRGPPGATYPEKLPSVRGHVHGALRAEERPWPGDVTRNSVVTGEQRFCDGLSMPFSLKLTGEPGDPGLRQVIIDGSNVAMSHGLGHFFSCRGIALAVQYFWKQGHRDVTTFVPQWRLKKDPKVKERHYLTDLQDLGLLSFTPSREVEGMRINSYDDRFMLQLAQRTDGVIVTNDNLRDLVDESPAWRDIIKKSLLQYTFVGDHFMVPDDPLGRGGPHLKEFLRTQHRSANPGSHTFAGTASPPHPPIRPHAQTEVLRYRDRTLGGAPSKGGPGESDGMKLWEKGRGRERGRAKVEPGEVGMDRERSSEQTSSLRERLARVFPGQDSSVTMALACNPSVTDINVLSDIILELLDEKGREV